MIFKTFKNKSLLLSLSLLIILTPLSTVIAENGDEEIISSVELIPGDLDFSVHLFEDDTDILFDSLLIQDLNDNNSISDTYSLDSIIIDDARGSGEGFELQVEATPFKNESEFVLDRGILTLESPVKIGNENDVYVHEDLNALDVEGTQTLLSAEVNKGLGKNEFEFNDDSLMLSISQKDARSGTYQSTITFTLTKGPS